MVASFLVHTAVNVKGGANQPGNSGAARRRTHNPRYLAARRLTVHLEETARESHQDHSRI